MKPGKLQHPVTRTRVKVSKLLELGVFQCPLWIRRVLVHPDRWPSARAQEGQYGRRKRGRFYCGLGLAVRAQEGQLKARWLLTSQRAFSVWCLPILTYTASERLVKVKLWILMA